MNDKMVLIIVCVLVVLIIIGIFTGNYNSFTRSKNKIIRAKGTIDVYLKQRFDLIPNLVEVVKGYSNYEESTLKELTELRTKYQTNTEKNIKEEADMNNNLTKLIGVVEAYPDLKASNNYLDLQHQLEKVESELQAARRIYNMEVTEYNDKIQLFPGNIFAALYHFKNADLFSINENEAENVNVNFENK